MISVEQALEKILDYVEALEAEERPLLECLGQVLAEDIRSAINVPPMDNSAMDGYAVQAADIKSASEKQAVVLEVVDTVPAGSISRLTVKTGSAIRIMTGAPVPRGADTVVPFEQTDETTRKDHSNVGVLAAIKPGANIRRAGEDILKGAMVLSQRTVLKPAHIGVLASLGYSRARVIRRPVVAILSTGDEVVDINQPLPPGKIYNSNAYSLAALAQRCGGVPRLLGIAQDKEESLIAKLQEGRKADMVITSGGVSAGDYDMVKDVLAREGEITFWTVRMKPGKPLAFGRFKSTARPGKYVPHLGLPGNPVSSMVTFELFACPAILKMMGKKDLQRPIVSVVLEEGIGNKDGRRVFARAIVERRDGQYYARLTGPQGSGILTSMAQANALVVVPEDKARLDKGDKTQAIMLDWGEE